MNHPVDEDIRQYKLKREQQRTHAAELRDQRRNRTNNNPRNTSNMYSNNNNNNIENKNNSNSLWSSSSTNISHHQNSRQSQNNDNNQSFNNYKVTPYRQQRTRSSTNNSSLDFSSNNNMNNNRNGNGFDFITGSTSNSNSNSNFDESVLYGNGNGSSCRKISRTEYHHQQQQQQQEGQQTNGNDVFDVFGNGFQPHFRRQSTLDETEINVYNQRSDRNAEVGRRGWTGTPMPHTLRNRQMINRRGHGQSNERNERNESNDRNDRNGNESNMKMEVKRMQSMMDEMQGNMRNLEYELQNEKNENMKRMQDLQNLQKIQQTIIEEVKKLKIEMNKTKKIDKKRVNFNFNDDKSFNVIGNGNEGQRRMKSSSFAVGNGGNQHSRRNNHVFNSSMDIDNDMGLINIGSNRNYSNINNNTNNNVRRQSPNMNYSSYSSMNTSNNNNSMYNSNMNDSSIDIIHGVQHKPQVLMGSDGEEYYAKPIVSSGADLIAKLDTLEGAFETVDHRVPCSLCNRKFVPSAMERHKRICKKIFGQKRKKFNTRNQRMDDEAAKANYQGRNASQMADMKLAKKKAKWKEQSGMLRDAMRCAKGGSMKSTVPDSRVPCPYCNRKFSEDAAARHIPKCKNIKAKPSFLKRRR